MFGNSLPLRADIHESLRIAVVRAGAAGLTAALALTDLGYQHVTIFEAGDRVRGTGR